MMSIPRRSLSFLLFLMLAAIASHSRADEMKAVRAAEPPRIDGELNDPCWASATPYSAFHILDTEKASPLKTEVRFVYDDFKLYVAVRCFTPNVALVKVKPVKRDERVMGTNDSVEIMIDADGDGDAYIHLGTNTSGSQYDRRVTQGGFVGSVEWDGEWRTASKIESDSYAVEFSIPFFDLDIGPRTGSTWNINVCRNLRMGSGGAYTSIAPRGVYNAPAQFPKLGGIDVDFRRYMIGVGPLQVSSRFEDKKTLITMNVDLADEATSSHAVRAENWLIDSTDNVQVKSAGEVRLDASGRQTLSFGPYELQESGKYRNWVILYDLATNRPLKVSKSSLQIDCVPISMSVTEPFYRNTIFASQKLQKVQFQVEAGLAEAELKTSTLHVQVKHADGERSVFQETRKDLKPVNAFEFAVSDLPADGKYLIRAVLRDIAGAELAHTEQQLLKLPYKAGEVWYGRDLVFHRDGKPIFPNGTWGMMTPERNFLLYGIFSKRIVTPVVPGKFKVWYTTDSKDHPLLKGSGTLPPEFVNDLRERIRFYKDDPDILAWVQPDEPEVGELSVDKLKQMYDIIREEDPYHPIWVSNDSLEGIKAYAETADAAVPHPYPPSQPDMPIADFSRLMHVQRAYLEHTNFTKPVGYMHQGFNYGEYVPGRRMPTYYELRNQNLLCLVDGGTFIMGYEASTPMVWYPEVTIGIDHMTRELAYLGRAVCAPKADNKVTVKEKDVVTLLKNLEGELWLFVSNASNSARRLEVIVEGLGARKLAVLSEARTIDAKNNVITDDFEPWQTHVYTTGKDDSGLLTSQQITDLIEAEYAKRHKQGNLAFQRWESESVEITCSSRKGEYPPQPWHVCDGVTDPSVYPEPFENLHVWGDNTSNQGPDWLAMKFHKAHEINRIAVYCRSTSVKDYQLQVFKDGNWVDVATGTENMKDVIDHTFETITTDQVRLYVTATNGAHVMVTEIEVYGE